MFQRSILTELQDLARSYPVVSLLGPRQSGKTTIVKYAFPEKAYVNLEEPDTRLLAETDPRGFLDAYPEGLILDEVQNVPHLLSYIQSIVDSVGKPGMYIVTGSHQLALHAAVSQSLAGRVALLNLLPLTLLELQQSNINLSLDEQIVHGFYPRIYDKDMNPTKVYRNYLQTYLEKDVRAISEIKNLSQFQRFMKLCAGRIGGVLDYASFSNDLGVSSHTVKHWFSILEASFVVYRLQPYFENFGKRIIKSPKLYFYDVGLATYLLDIQSASQLSRDPARGGLVENLVVMELIKQRFNAGLDPNLYYYRDHHGNEVDVIIKQGNQLTPIEIKSSKTITLEFFKGLRYVKSLLGDRCETGYLIYAGDKAQEVEGFTILNYRHATNAYL